jgi:hypothetical protein
LRRLPVTTEFCPTHLGPSFIFTYLPTGFPVRRHVGYLIGTRSGGFHKPALYEAHPDRVFPFLYRFFNLWGLSLIQPRG